MDLGYTENYCIHRMVFVNSGSSAYVELPMDKTAALFGRNNEGKTSGLSALKLFVLPEVNFKGCQAKFAFGSGGELYTAQQSYQHYFPDNSSFIIMEAENPRNRFCMVLHRSNEEWGYGRIAIPLPYDDIKSLFWNFESTKNNGLGEPVADLRLADVIAALKKRKGLVLNTVQDIREAIYRRPGVLDDSSRYCIVPLLQKGEGGSVKALSALLGLAFDIKGTLGGSLPNAIATIIEGEISSSNNKIDIDIGGISSQYDDLKQRNSHLNVVRDSFPKWRELESVYSELLESDTTVSTLYATLISTLRQKEAAESTQVGKLRQELQAAMTIKARVKAERKEQQRELQTLKTQRETKKGDLEAANEDLARVEEVLTEAKILGLDEVEAVYGWLEEYIEEKAETLKALEDLDAGQKRLEELNSKVSLLAQAVEKSKQSVEEVSAGVLESLPHDVRDVLFSINPRLAEVNASVTDEQSATIAKFSGLLGQQDGMLSFLSSPVPGTPFVAYDREAERQRRQDRVEEQKAEHREAVEKRDALHNELKNHMAGLSRERVSALQEEIDAAQRDVQLLQGRVLREVQKGELEAVVAALGKQIEESELRWETVESRYAESTMHVSRLEGELVSLQPLLTELQQMREQIEKEFRRLGYADVEQSLTSPDEDGVAVDLEELRSAAAEFDEAARNLPTLHYQAVQLFGVMFENGILQGESNPMHIPRAHMAQLSGWYEELRAEFTNLEGNLQKHKNDIIHHNHTTSTRADLLRQLGSTIRKSEKKINDELARYQISNLESTQVKLELDPRFESLLKDFSDESFQATDQLRSSAFYERLSSFCNEFFKDGRSGRKIDLASVITGVSYSFMKDGELTKAGQSNGTTSMLNSAMLAILLKRLIPEGVSLKFPIVFDEVGSLDKPNLQAVKQVAEDHGFLLFVANPENTGVIGSTVDHWYDLSLLRVTEGSVIKHCTVLYYQLEEGFRPEMEPVLEMEV